MSVLLTRPLLICNPNDRLLTRTPLDHMHAHAQNNDTPLHIAAAMGRRKLTKILMQNGAELVIKNKVSFQLGGQTDFPPEASLPPPAPHNKIRVAGRMDARARLS